MGARMKQFGFELESEIEKVEDSLLRTREEFELYRADFEGAYETVQLLIAHRESGFSNSSEGELQAQRIVDSVQVYNRLSMQIDLWLKRIQEIVARISRIERQALGEGETVVDENIRESALRNISRN
jgi:hypothetical protein